MSDSIYIHLAVPSLQGIFRDQDKPHLEVLLKRAYHHRKNLDSYIQVLEAQIGIINGQGQKYETAN